MEGEGGKGRRGVGWEGNRRAGCRVPGAFSRSRAWMSGRQDCSAPWPDLDGAMVELPLESGVNPEAHVLPGSSRMYHGRADCFMRFNPDAKVLAQYKRQEGAVPSGHDAGPRERASIVKRAAPVHTAWHQ